MRRLLGALMLVLATLLLPGPPAHAADFDLTFVHGKSYGVASNSVLRGERDHYYFGARPGQKLEVNLRAASLETTIRRAGRRLAISLTAGAAILATALTAVSSNRVAGWVPVAFGVISAGLLLALLVDLIRKRG